MPDIKNDFFAQVLTGLEGLASEEGFKIITCLTNESYKKEVDYLATLNKETIDGFIIAAAQETRFFFMTSLQFFYNLIWTELLLLSCLHIFQGKHPFSDLILSG